MDFISTALVTLKQPTGFWESILNFFKSGVGSYILAIILISLIVRVVFALVDVFSKKVNMKNSDINAKMKPELDAIQKKYGHDQRLVQQKTQEIYKKYQFSMMGSCLPMLITMVLQITVFFTLWNSLQAVSNYNIAEKYENVKNVYANVIALNDDTTSFETFYNQGDEIKVEVDLKNNTLTLQNLTTNEVREDLKMETFTNEEIYTLLAQYVMIPEEDEAESQAEEDTPDETIPTIEYVNTGYNEVLKSLAEVTAKNVYLNTQEGFLWIKNIYKAESPTSPLFTKEEIKSYLSKFYTAEEKELEETKDYEGQIFDCVVAGMNKTSMGLNGYYILTILAVVSSFFSTWLNNKLMKSKNQPAGQKQNKLMYFIMPVIIGIFTMSYTSLFAIYLIVGQLVMIAITPLTTWIVRKWIDAEAKKKKDKNVIEVDYRRKDI